VIEQIAKGGTHNDANFRRPTSGALVFLDSTPGVPLRSTPGFNSDAPSGRYRHTHYRKPQPTFRRCTREHAVRGGVPLRSTPGFSSDAPSGCSGGMRRGGAWGFANLSAEGAKEYSREWSVAELPETDSLIRRTPGKGWRRGIRAYARGKV
jgi:hypothetical protein